MNRDVLTLEQLKAQREAVKGKIEQLAQKKASATEIKRAEDYLKLLDARIKRL